MPTCKLTNKKLIHTSSFEYFAFIFPEYGTITSSEEALEMCEGARFLSGNKAKSSVNLPVQLRFILVNFIKMAFDVLLT